MYQRLRDLREDRDMTQQDVARYLSFTHSVYDIVVKAQTGLWPPTKEEKEEAEKQFITRSPTTLISNLKSQPLFTQEELQIFIPRAEEQWIEWKGKLPDDYISLLKTGNQNS